MRGTDMSSCPCLQPPRCYLPLAPSTALRMDVAIARSTGVPLRNADSMRSDIERRVLAGLGGDAAPRRLVMHNDWLGVLRACDELGLGDSGVVVQTPAICEGHVQTEEVDEAG
jgi:hypothetical protein